MRIYIFTNVTEVLKRKANKIIKKTEHRCPNFVFQSCLSNLDNKHCKRKKAERKRKYQQRNTIKTIVVPQEYHKVLLF